jgi:hypothetical protein
VAHFLGYEVHTLDADDKHDHRGQRCINGAIGLRVPKRAIQTYCAKYQRKGKPIHLIRRVNDSAYSIVASYQTEYRGLVQYYRLAYNLHTFSRLKGVMEISLVKTLACKFKTNCRRIYRRYRTLHTNEFGTYKVLAVKLEQQTGQVPLVARFGGIPLRWNKWVKIKDQLPEPIWSGRSELTQRLLAQQCELCGATNAIEVHHIRKLADLQRTEHCSKPDWLKVMATRQRKTLVVCQNCHHLIHSGRYDKSAISK